ncbi:hypothetical protein [Sinosporangium siamense]|uniref:Uncharacterized protein n=1 Tax=Sinosporangium siamense TaxID=1367973 RepID=A0A919V5H4_9ACTN|nr:hypothetical protein [Sinosporangium siamense]GII93015.1 hypothetical protein Ssi02_32460 [Sinosporangium siamense]
MLAVIDFQGGPGTGELMEGVASLKGMNRLGGRKVPVGAPTSFVPARYADYLDRARVSQGGRSGPVRSPANSRRRIGRADAEPHLRVHRRHMARRTGAERG